MSIRKVLVTGAGGLMGGYVIDKMLGDYDLYGIDILPDTKGLPHIEDTILNYEAVRRACEGIDAGPNSSGSKYLEGTHKEIIHTNVTGTWNVQRPLKKRSEKGNRYIEDSVIGYTVLSGSMIARLFTS